MRTRGPSYFLMLSAFGVLVGCGALPVRDDGARSDTETTLVSDVALRECDLPLSNPLQFWLDRGNGTVILGATVESLGGGQLTPTIYGNLILRSVVLRDTQVLMSATPANARTQELVLEVGDPSDPDPTRGTTQIDGDHLVGKEVLLIASAPSHDEASPLYLVGAATLSADGTVRFPGTCDVLLSAQLDGMTRIFRSQGRAWTQADIILGWINSLKTGSDTSLYVNIGLEASNSQSSQPNWDTSPPISRGLSPDVLPETMLERLGVVGLFVSITDLPTDSILVVRTESGVGAATRVGDASELPIPTYFLSDVDRRFRLSISPAKEMLAAEGPVFASVPIVDFDECAGIEVKGRISDNSLTVTTLSADAVAKRMNMSKDALLALRDSLLAAPTDRTTNL